MAAAQALENHGEEWSLTWYFRWGIDTSIPTWAHSQNSLATAEALSLKISSHRTSLLSKNDHKDHPNQHKNSHNQCNETGHPLWIWWKVNGNWGNNMIRIGKAIVKQILASEEKKNPKQQDCENDSLGSE